MTWHPPSTDELRSLYETTRWRRRARAFRRMHPRCMARRHSPRCDGRGTIVDHVVPRSQARSELELRRRTWDQRNWQTLSESCHNAKTFGEMIARASRPATHVADTPASDVITTDYTLRADDGAA